MKTILEGRMSTFGGPNDIGVSPCEGLALVDLENFDSLKEYFLINQPPETTGLARRLDPQKYYIACRWDYATTPQRYLRKILVEVKNPKNGKSIKARPMDWGPAAWTGRIADLSPGLAKFLELKTDDLCIVEIPYPGTEISGSRQPFKTVNGNDSHLTVLTEAEIKAEFGSFNYKDHPRVKGAITILPSWPEENLISVEIPQLKRLPTYDNKNFSGKFKCHKKAEKPLQKVFAEIERQNLKDKLLFWGGCYVSRHKSWNPQRGLSSHSWGIAIDINVQWNGYNKEPARKGKHGSVVELVPIFESFGFAWGGYFSTPDGMHFEYAVK